MKKIRIAALAAALSCLLTACCDYRELNDLAIVRAAAVDASGAGVRVTAHASAGEKAASATAEGQSAAQAFGRARSAVGPSLYWSHMESLVIGRALVRGGGLLPLIDVLCRERELRPSVHLYLAEGDAARLFEDAPEGAIDDLSKTFHESRRGPLLEMRAFELLNLLAERGADGCLPVVSIEEEELRLTGVAALSADEIAFILDEEQMRTFAVLRAHAEETEFPVSAADTTATVRVSQSASDIDARYEAGRASFVMRVRLKAVLSELDGAKEPRALLDPAFHAAVEQALSAQLTARADALISELKRARSDILGFGRAFIKKYPAWEEEDLRALFGGSDIRVEIETELVGSGLLITPLRER